MKNQAQKQLNKLANFLMKYYPHEFGRGSSPNDSTKGKCKMKIRLGIGDFGYDHR